LHSVKMLFFLFFSTSFAASREQINFDFSWRHSLGADPSCNHDPGEKGINYGTGGDVFFNISSAAGCCNLCGVGCNCWDWNPASLECWVKLDCSSEEPADRVSARRSAGLPPPAAEKFDDSTWSIVDCPHDMLIAQNFSEMAPMKQAYLYRATGWYRKHFSLPSDWNSSTVYLYCEGSFHTTTVFLNGYQLAPSHRAGYTSWSLHLNEFARFGEGSENVLAVYIDASKGTGWWYEGGGLTRHLYLVRASRVHVVPDSAWVYSTSSPPSPSSSSSSSPSSPSSPSSSSPPSSPSSSSSLSVIFVGAVTVQNSYTTEAMEVRVRLCVLDDSGALVGNSSTSASVVVPAGLTHTFADLSVPLSAGHTHLWSVQSPYLYTVAVHVYASDAAAEEQEGGGRQDAAAVDTVEFSAGARSVAFDADKGLFVNQQPVKLRGFCDHDNMGGVGAAVPDRVNLFRAQMLRASGGNSWRMAHNPPAVARLDMMDRLGMLAVDENRDYGGQIGQGGTTPETVAEELGDMKALISRDRSHPSVLVWSFCNEVGCKNESAAQAFRAVSKAADPSRLVTQNHLGTNLSSFFLDVQGFSHKHADVYAKFHAQHPDKPMMATECCSCMSQRGVDEDMCPHPQDGGCEDGPKVPPGVFYNNNIGQCTADQVVESDSLDYLTGTFVWSGFDYLGEARGWPQNVKCRGTLADVAGFTKETAYWFKSWWLSNISKSDAGRPLNPPQPCDGQPTHSSFTSNSSSGSDSDFTVFIIDTWAAIPGASGSNRSIHVYTNAPFVRLEVNGHLAASPLPVPFFGMATFSVQYRAGRLRAVAMAGEHGSDLASHTLTTAGSVASVVLTLDAPSALTGTGSALVLDGQDTAMVRASLVDAQGIVVPASDNKVTFRVVSGPGKVWATHNGDPANLSPSLAAWTPAYHGLARAFVRTTMDASSSSEHRRRLRQIDLDTPVNPSLEVLPPEQVRSAPSDIVVEASVPGLAPSKINIPVTVDLHQLPLAVASFEGKRSQQFFRELHS